MNKSLVVNKEDQTGGVIRAQDFIKASNVLKLDAIASVEYKGYIRFLPMVTQGKDVSYTTLDVRSIVKLEVKCKNNKNGNYPLYLEIAIRYLDGPELKRYRIFSVIFRHLYNLRGQDHEGKFKKIVEELDNLILDMKADLKAELEKKPTTTF